MTPRFVIIGNGVAGITAARTIAQTRPGAAIEIYAAEPYPYYSRPRLWEFLAGEIAQKDLYFYPPAWYKEQGIQVHLDSRVASLSPAKKEITLADGSVVPYDKLLLAMGSRAFVPPIPGADKQGVFTLRTADDARAMKAYAPGAKRAVAIGGGLLGLETARALRLLGLEVTVLEINPRLMPRQLDTEGAAVLTRLIEGMGLHVITNATTQAILGDGRASGVALQSGEVIPGELILFSAGVRPNVSLAQEAGLKVGKGVTVDQYLRTSAEGVYAAGDVAEFEGRLYGIIPAAIEQAQMAGAHMAGADPAPYKGTIPANTLKIVGIDLTCIGVAVPEGAGYQELRWVDEAGQCYKKLTLQGGRLVGAILLGDKKDVAPVSKLIASGVDVSAYVGHLLEEDFDLKALAAKPPPKGEKAMDKWECLACGYIYDPEKGDPDSGIKPGTPFEELPDDWVCPQCGAAKDMFEKVKK